MQIDYILRDLKLFHYDGATCYEQNNSTITNSKTSRSQESANGKFKWQSHRLVPTFEMKDNGNGEIMRITVWTECRLFDYFSIVYRVLNGVDFIRIFSLSTGFTYFTQSSRVIVLRNDLHFT